MNETLPTHIVNPADLPTSVILHTSVPFGVKHIDLTVPEAEPILKEVHYALEYFVLKCARLYFEFYILIKALKRSFPDLPSPKAFKCHKWRYSQVLTNPFSFLCACKFYLFILFAFKVTKPYEDQPGVLELSQEPLLLVGGDGFTHSNFDGCVSSAGKIIQHFASKTANL